MSNYILKIVEAIARGEKDAGLRQFVSQSEAEIKQEIDFLIENRDKVPEIVKGLFPQGIPTNPTFYRRLTDIGQLFGFRSSAYPLMGLLWVEAYKLLPQDEELQLLTLLVTNKQINFFVITSSLPFFLSQIELPPDFAVNWFIALYNKVAKDLAGGGVIQGIENYAYSYPSSGLRVFEKFFVQGVDQSNLHIAAIILGALRSSADAGQFQKEVIVKWDNTLINSPKTELRLCYHRSWLIPCRRGLITIDELEKKLHRMIEGTQEEVAEAFNVLYRCFLNNLKDGSFIKFTCQWYERNIQNNISELAKYYVVHSVMMLMDAIKENLIEAGETDKLIIQVQPVSADSNGTWQEIEHYLVSRLQNDKKSFYELFTQLFKINSNTIVNRFKNDEFAYLISEMQGIDVSDYVTELIISKEKTKRDLGFILFKELKIGSLNGDILKAANDKQLRIVLLESIRKPMTGGEASEFFIMLAYRFQDASPGLTKEFKQEMLMQAINYPGECLAVWRKMEKPSELVKSIVESAEQYFNKMESTRKLPAVSFAFPELKRALQLSRREQSRELAKGVNDKSILAKLAKHVDIIYGNLWSSMVEGKLGEATPFREFSHSMELPRLELIDPEGMTIRRMQAAAEINKLLQTED